VNKIVRRVYAYEDNDRKEPFLAQFLTQFRSQREFVTASVCDRKFAPGQAWEIPRKIVRDSIRALRQVLESGVLNLF
jgi:hypothetical protein